MISFITGSILKTNIAKDSYVDILTQAGIAYRISIPSSYICPSKGEIYSLYTHFHVREDAQTLYGFEKEDERDFFELLITVSGIGPKIALAILSTFSRVDLESVISEGDARGLSRVSGLGLKGAQKIILELRGKVDFDIKDSKEENVVKDLKNALKSLGFSGDILKEKVEVGQKMIDKNKEIEIEVLIKEVLSK
ncbi:MAG: Holliday junction branch migration protein RuvA [Candidatus Dojkabacteria bacterium]